MSWYAYFRSNQLVILPCVGCLSVGTPPSQTVLWTSSEFSLFKRLPGTQPEIVHAHQQLHRVFPYMRAHALWHMWYNQSNEPPLRRGSHINSGTASEHPGQGEESRSAQRWGWQILPNGWATGYGNARCQVRHVQKKKGIKTRSRVDWPFSGM